ncbi:MAG TPA: hypothetical protein VFR94_17735, partial [Nitrososphaeraceae archaeon]|nr:hypothetical protein [Nitrososphaeraceae archaeon]
RLEPQEIETTRHDDTRVVSGGLLRPIYNTHKIFKRFLRLYTITYFLVSRPGRSLVEKRNSSFMAVLRIVQP